MVDMFDANKANFRGILETRQKLYVSDIISNAFVDVNEDGSEAAAACKDMAYILIYVRSIVK